MPMGSIIYPLSGIEEPWEGFSQWNVSCDLNDYNEYFIDKGTLSLGKHSISQVQTQSTQYLQLLQYMKCDLANMWFLASNLGKFHPLSLL